MQKVVIIDNTPSTKSAFMWNLCLKRSFSLILNIIDLGKIKQKGKDKREKAN